MAQVRAGPATLAGEFGRFARNGSPRIIAAAFLAAAVARIAVGRWSIGDLIVAAAILAVQPFTEWLIHVYVLHSPGNSLVAREHRSHHADPTDEHLVFVPIGFLVPSLAVAAVITLVLVPDRVLGLTGLSVGLTMLLVYEWTHHLIHGRYRPKTMLYRKVWRAHRLHHYRNEQYWYGVTMHLGDRVLRTYPAKDAVPLSDTARTLGA